MGRAKEEWMRQQELEPMYEWIEENYGDDAGEEGSDTWEEAVQAWEDYCEDQQKLEYESYLQDELDWILSSKSQIEVFQSQVKSVEKLLEMEIDNETQFSLLVMLHGHVVAAVEAYLSSTFIHKITNSEELTRKLIETDPAFSKMKFTLKEIFEKQENLKQTVVSYLKDFIFHDLHKVKPMYKNVLGYNFGDISWLFKAITKRHHCVHRAGFDKERNKIDLSVNSIKELVTKSFQLVKDVELEVSQIPEKSIFLFEE